MKKQIAVMLKSALVLGLLLFVDCIRMQFISENYLRICEEGSPKRATFSRAAQA
jgi:hypothetical protein